MWVLYTKWIGKSPFGLYEFTPEKVQCIVNSWSWVNAFDQCTLHKMLQVLNNWLQQNGILTAMLRSIRYKEEILDLIGKYIKGNERKDER